MKPPDPFRREELFFAQALLARVRFTSCDVKSAFTQRRVNAYVGYPPRLDTRVLDTPHPRFKRACFMPEKRQRPKIRVADVCSS